MLKMVLKDYREEFCISRMKKMGQFGYYWIFIYMLTIFPVLLNLQEKTDRMIRYYAFTIPLLFGIFSLGIIPIRLPKQMFLCPLSQKEREKYLHTLFGVRLIIPVILGALSYGMLVVIGMSNGILFWLQLFGMFSLMLLASITSWPGSTWERTNGNKVRLKNPKFRGLYGISLTGVCGAAFFLMIPIIGWDGIIDGFFVVIMIILGITILVCDVLVTRYYKTMIKENIQYESSYEIINHE